MTRTLVVFPYVLLAGTFLLDLWIPLGYVTWSSHVLALLAAATYSSKQQIVIVAILACLLMWLAVLLNYQGSVYEAITNRFFGTGLILLTTALCLRSRVDREKEIELQKSLHEADVKHQLAREMQVKLNPRTAPNIPGFDIAGVSVPADITGGDYFDFVPLAGATTGIAVGDASGHGTTAAMVITTTRAYLRAFAQTHDNPDTILVQVNQFLDLDLAGDHFVTMFFCILDSRRKTVAYAGAGHQGFCFDAAGNLKQPLNPNGLPLATAKNPAFAHVTPVSLQPGEMVVITTDGIQESVNSSGEYFGVDGTLKVVEQHHAQSACRIADTLIAAAQEHAAPQPQHDDMTVVVVKCLPGAS